MTAGGVIRGWMLAAGLLGACPAVHAQTTVSAAVESDYRFRGVSLSDGTPDIWLNLDYDHRSGAYAGVSVIGTGGGYAGQAHVAAIVYAGFASRPVGGMSWDGGIVHTHDDDYDYDEVYGGVNAGAASLRLSYSPHYYGRRAQTLYTDLRVSRPLSANWRVFAHAGALTPLSGYVRRPRYDVQAGAAVTTGRCEFQLSLSRTARFWGYGGRDYGGQAAVLTVSYVF